jgi:uncharacterized membrane-anchored protein YitT (DUF2179 family)
MKQAGIVTSGIAGIALLVSFKVQIGVGALFFLLNIPFFLLGLKVLGKGFLVRTIIACTLIFFFAWVTQRATHIEMVHPAFAALAGGTSIGMGILARLRHNSGVGGVNIVALWLQKSRGWNVGRLHLVLDGAILLFALTIITPEQLAWSALSIIAINGILIAYHRPTRYIGH